MNEKKHIDPQLKSMLPEVEVPGHFTSRVMKAVEAEKAATRTSVYRPVIPKVAQYAMITAFLFFIAAAFTWGEESSFTWIENLRVPAFLTSKLISFSFAAIFVLLLAERMVKRWSIRTS